MKSKQIKIQSYEMNFADIIFSLSFYFRQSSASQLIHFQISLVYLEITKH